MRPAADSSAVDAVAMAAPATLGAGNQPICEEGWTAVSCARPQAGTLERLLLLLLPLGRRAIEVLCSTLRMGVLAPEAAATAGTIAHQDVMLRQPCRL